MANIKFWQKPAIKATTDTTAPGGDVVERPDALTGIHKTFIPNFLYKPPFGYPRSENILQIKNFARNPYIFAVINALQEEAASNDWKIAPDDDVDMTDELKEKAKEIKNFLLNPNGNKEGFSTLTKTMVRDVCEIDSGVWVKVFNRAGKLVEIYGRDGGAFLKNPDIYGYIGNRQDIILPTSQSRKLVGVGYEGDNKDAINQYAQYFNDNAAYYQYGYTHAALPVPFGKREIVYFMKNPRGDNIYGISPVQILGDIILTLVYGSYYNLDFYKNSNMPEGIISLEGAPKQEIKAFKARMEKEFTMKDALTGFARKIGFKMPVTSFKPAFTPFQIPAREMQIIEQQQWFSKIVWMCFGVSADDMGFSEDSNKAVSQTNEKRYAKKAVRPILNMIAERINQEILPEFGTDELKFKWDDYDLEEDIKKHSLYKMQIDMGIKTSEMVAEEEDIDVVLLKKQKEENQEKETENQMKLNGSIDQEEKDGMRKTETKEKVKADVVNKDGTTDEDEFETSELEEEMIQEIKAQTRKVEAAIMAYKEGSLDVIS